MTLPKSALLPAPGSPQRTIEWSIAFPREPETNKNTCPILRRNRDDQTPEEAPATVAIEIETVTETETATVIATETRTAAAVVVVVAVAVEAVNKAAVPVAAASRNRFL